MDNRLAAHWRRFRSDATEEHFLPVYEATHRLVWTICLRVLVDETDARDAFQAVYTRLLSEASREDDPVALASRLAGLEADALRKRRARLARREVKTMEESDAIAGAEQITGGLAQAQLRALLERETARLEEDLRVAVELHFLDGLTQREVAGALGVSVSTVNDRLKRALERLRPLLRRAGIERPEDALPMLLPLAMLLVPPRDLSAAGVFAAAGRVAPVAGAAAKAGSAGVTTATLSKIAALLMVVAVVVAGYAVLRGRSTPPPPRVLAAVTLPAEPTTKAPARTPTSTPAPVATAAPAAAPPATATATATPARAGIRLGGILVDEVTGAPVPDTLIRVFGGSYATSGTGMTMGTGGKPAEVVTSASGEFSFEGLEPVSYLLFVDSKTHRLLDDQCRNFLPGDLTNGSDQPNLRLEAWPGVKVTGTVSDAVSKQPLEGVRVRSANLTIKMQAGAWGEPDRPWHDNEAVTGPDGHYSITTFGENTTVVENNVMSIGLALNLWFYKDGYTSRHKYGLPGASMSPVVMLSRDQREATQDFLLAPAVDCHLLVVDQAGRPVAKARVNITSSFAFAMAVPNDGTEIRTDAEGKAVLHIAPDMQTDLSVTAEGFPPARDSLTLKESNAASPRRITLAAVIAKPLRFRVVDEAGEPARALGERQTTVYLSNTVTHGADVGKWMDGESAIIEFATFDPATLAAGNYSVTFPGGSEYEGLRHTVTAEDLASGEPATLVLKRPRLDLHLSGTIRGQHGEPVSGATVFGYHTDFSTTTDQEGRYEIAVPTHTQTLGVRHPELGVSAIRKIHEGDGNDLDWRTANAIAEVTLIDGRTGGPAQEFSVSTGEEWSQHFLKDPDRPGVFFVEQGIGPGKIQLKVRIATSDAEQVTIDIPEGAGLFSIEHRAGPHYWPAPATPTPRVVWMAGT